ncbi:response regulator [Novosphingobium album (ex Liu et al. 2023)]|uniref:Response regulator n=1 Tax=Novosphingobium album (ex Liu et al. 2023) TaxID=3031130 RepID=A0ABT5WSP2_9SPHN|nr:response regulator [Novosphingobium album (ex Liu et al. 2023)]MDE8652766.1 response regulator [Novosphingobium album (ex Liu et al. 2023)]
METPPESARDGRIVLIVEDEHMVRNMAADMFMAYGYHILEASNAADALCVLEARGDIEAVFTDIEMPGPMNGLLLASEVRGRWPQIAVLITSGRLRPSGDMMPVGADFGGKPYRSDDVIRRIEALASAA